MPRPIFAAVLLALSAPGVASAKPPAPAKPPAVHAYLFLALSPDGSRLADVESARAGDAAPGPGVLTIRSAADGRVMEKINAASVSDYGGLAWSPDGKEVAFLASNGKAGTVSLEAADGAGRLRVLAKISGVASTPRWSPDGKTVALLATAGARKLTGATQAGVPQVGEIGETNDEQRIAVVPAQGGALRFVSPADTFVYEYDWTPDGRGFVATAAKGNGDNNWWVARLDAVDAATGTVREIAAPPVQMDYPRVSPDGKTVAFIGGLMSDFGSVGGDIYTVPLAGGTPVDITPGYAGSFTSLVWRGAAPLATALLGENSAAVAIDPLAHTTRTLWSAPVTTAAGDARMAFSTGGTAAAVVQDFGHASRIFAGTLANLRPITRDNDALPSPYSARSISWVNGGFHAQGWLLGPLAATLGKTYPMVVLVHGGPGAAVTPYYDPRGLVHDLVGKGCFVLEPNPRGSFGQGEAFTRANIRDFGGGDLSDILAGVDAAEKIAPIDDKRLGIGGHSYGGFMTMWAVTHTQRFQVAVAGAGIANWISYYGENGIDQWMIPFFGASAYDDPAIYRKLSPLETIKQAKTPTFIYVGERDVECPAPQSVEFWHGLREMGVPTKLVIYAGEGHGIRRPEHLRDLNTRTLGWFDHYLGTGR